jgi:hypothetical protein
MQWFKRPLPKKNSNKIVQMEDVDIIAKLLADVSVKKDKQFYQRLAFVDKEKRIFLAELKGLLTGIDKGDVLKLRSIGILASNGQFKITFSSYSNFMVLQKNFKDARELIVETRNVSYDQAQLRKEFLKELHLSKRKKEMIGPNTFIYKSRKKCSDPEGSQKNLEIIFPILKNFDYDVQRMGELTCDRTLRKQRPQICSAILSKHSTLPILPLKEILKQMRNIEKKKKKSKKKKLFTSDFLRVKVGINKVEHTDFYSNFKIFSPSSNRTLSLEEASPKNMPDDAKIIFYNVFSLTDDSISEEEDNWVHSYLITYNENPKYIYDLWRLLPDPLVVKDWLAIEEQRKHRFTKCLQRLSSPNKEFNLVLQIVEAEGGKVYLKIVDSIFWIARQGLS